MISYDESKKLIYLFCSEWKKKESNQTTTTANPTFNNALQKVLAVFDNFLISMNNEMLKGETSHYSEL